jgi:ribulose-phosphate 3-epimerase
MPPAGPLRPDSSGSLRPTAPGLSAGILSADLMRLGEQIGAVEAAGIRMLHFDVMDGRFVPPMTIGPAFVKAVRGSLLKDVHLMVEHPEAVVADYAAAGADSITVHAESSPHVHRALTEIGRAVNANDPARGIARGVALNPGTPLEALEPLLEETDIVWLLAIDPGWTGQTLQDGVYRRLDRLRTRIAGCGRDVLVGVDGGIDAGNIEAVAAAGADLVVSGSAVFAGGRIAENASVLLGNLRAGARRATAVPAGRAPSLEPR